MNLYSVTFVVLPNEHWRMAVRADSPYEALEQALPHYSAAYCSRGHLRTEATTYTNTNGTTRCRICKRRGESERMARKAVTNV